MTTVTFKNGCLCADRLVQPYNGLITKLARNQSGDIAAILGTLSIAQRWLRAFAVNADELPSLLSSSGDSKSNAQAVVVRKIDGSVEFWDEDGYAVFEAPYHAFGTGRKYAAAAMEAGASAKRAVEIASKFDSSTGLGVDILKL